MRGFDPKRQATPQALYRVALRQIRHADAASIAGATRIYAAMQEVSVVAPWR